jgi:ribonucleoside-diphosphate reductase alpha chain
MDRVRSLPDAVARALESHLAGWAGGSSISGSDAAGEEMETPVAPANQTQGGATAASGNGGHPAGGLTNGHSAGLGMGTLALYTVTGNLCPHCGCNTMVYEEGCKKCYSCGHSEC